MSASGLSCARPRLVELYFEVWQIYYNWSVISAVIWRPIRQHPFVSQHPTAVFVCCLTSLHTKELSIKHNGLMNREFKNRFARHFCPDDAPSSRLSKSKFNKFIKPLAPHPSSGIQLIFSSRNKTEHEWKVWNVFNWRFTLTWWWASLPPSSFSVRDFLLFYKIEFTDRAGAVNFPSNWKWQN